jgi:hypothetical protein
MTFFIVTAVKTSNLIYFNLFSVYKEGIALYTANMSNGDSSVDIAAGYGLDDVGVRVQVRSTVSFSIARPDWLWSSFNLII